MHIDLRNTLWTRCKRLHTTYWVVFKKLVTGFCNIDHDSLTHLDFHGTSVPGFMSSNWLPYWSHGWTAQLVERPRRTFCNLRGHLGYPKRKNYGRPFLYAYYLVPPDTIANHSLSVIPLIPVSVLSLTYQNTHYIKYAHKLMLVLSTFIGIMMSSIPIIMYPSFIHFRLLTSVPNLFQ